MFHCTLFTLVSLFYNRLSFTFVCLFDFAYSLLIFVIDFVCTVFIFYLTYLIAALYFTLKLLIVESHGI